MEKDLLECSKTGEVVVFVSKVVAVPKEVINASKPRYFKLFVSILSSCSSLSCYGIPLYFLW